MRLFESRVNKRITPPTDRRYSNYLNSCELAAKVTDKLVEVLFQKLNTNDFLRLFTLFLSYVTEAGIKKDCTN